jgi:hypothetical protein
VRPNFEISRAIASSYCINGAAEAGGELNSSITVAVLRLDSATFECLIFKAFAAVSKPTRFETSSP